MHSTQAILNYYHWRKQVFFEQLMSDNFRIQQVKIITIWWQHYDMHGSKFFLAESVQDIIQNLSKATMWSKMTEYVENLKRRENNEPFLKMASI